MSSLSGFEQEAKGELLLFSVSFLKDIGERAGLFSVEGSTINALWYKGWKMFVYEPGVHFLFCWGSSFFGSRQCENEAATLRKLKRSPASRPGLFHLCQMALKRMFHSLSTGSCGESNFEGRAVLPNGTLTIFKGFVLLCKVSFYFTFTTLLCITIVGFWLWFTKHWWFLFYFVLPLWGFY